VAAPCSQWIACSPVRKRIVAGRSTRSLAVMGPEEFQQRFKAHIAADSVSVEMPDLARELSEFVTFDPDLLERYRLSADDIVFLSKAGLPRQAAPFLGFSAYAEKDLENLYTVGYLPRTLFPLGSNGSGDPLGIELRSRAIVYLNHDDGMRRILINSSLSQFAESLCAYQEARRAGTLKEFLRGLEAMDSPAAIPGAMWHTEIAGQQTT
jgi:SUKH-4 immunity protein